MNKLIDALAAWYERRTPNQMLLGLIALLLAFQVARLYLSESTPSADCSIDWDGRSNREVCD